MHKLLRVTALALIGINQSSQSAIIISDFTTQVNDRFSNDPSFIGAGYDFSGVAIADENPGSNTSDTDGRWVTMISRNVFLSVQHATFYPNNGQSVTFYASNDPSGATTTRTVQNSQRIGTSDIRIGVLDSPIPSNFTHYDYATETFETTGLPPGTAIETPLAPYYGETAFMLGRSPGTWETSQDMAVGQNVLDRWFVDFDNPHDAVGAIRDSNGDPDFATSEAYLIAGDSGGPLMVDDGLGNLTIVGLNWFAGTLESGEQISGFSYLGNYTDQIEDFIALNPIPEPSQYTIIYGLVLMAFLGIRRRPGQ